MSRRPWTVEEDRVLKMIYIERGERKWSKISKIMQEQFQIKDRSGKQCRERYTNQLDQNIKIQEWSRQQTQILLKTQKQIGNKWTAIASLLPGRSDNCVKNHFYSKIRKSLRTLNRIITKQLKKQYRIIKTQAFSKIIETVDQPFRKEKSADLYNYQPCREIVDSIILFQDQISILKNLEQKASSARLILEKLALILPQIKKPALKSSKKCQLKYSLQQNPSQSQGLLSSTKFNDNSSQLSLHQLFSSTGYGKNTRSTLKTSNHFSHHLLSRKTEYRSAGHQFDSSNDEQLSQQNNLNQSEYFDIDLIEKAQQLKINPIKSIYFQNLHKCQQQLNMMVDECNQIIQQDPSNNMFDVQMNILQDQSNQFVISPKGLTCQQKWQIQNQNMFLGQSMDIQESVKKPNLLESIPKLMRINRNNFGL